MEDLNGMGDGMLSSPIAIAVPGSSTFTTAPSITGVPTQTAVAFSFDVAHDASATQGAFEDVFETSTAKKVWCGPPWASRPRQRPWTSSP